ncbi:serine hydrolase domain-containing protein [Taibaiella chishuiensis]|uniref:D-alanyl-D-alanine carboxypeptidase n=1 Tax=Taibaiella chishuiensis TaxID=1434707 RepID=A0A2P8CZK0_9BACT|nr:serine hydrolase domain-containing protein [Taibaiella chishuiensis]PSK90390.1 D-alanyl-D-alanine carboxypeptidase [Taibaiella chishuiensis]
MKNNLFACLLLLSFVTRPMSMDAREAPGGGKKHAQPALNLFPDPAAYDPGISLQGSLKDSLDQVVRQLFAATGMPGITAAMLIPGKGLWETDTGFIAKPAQKKVDTQTVFYWASTAKMLTATVIDQLVQEQKLQYDSKLSLWYPDLQDAKRITVRQLLEHTSGMYSFNNDPKVFAIEKYYTPDELIALSAAQPNLFAPGKYWSYSNTNYLLLALIAEKIEGKTFGQIVQERIAGPLHLSSLKVLSPGERPGNLALAHQDGQVIKEDHSVPLGAGNVVANARDMVVFLNALLTGKLLPVATVHGRLRNLYAMPDAGTWYGSGLMLYDFNEINQVNDLWIGHSGGTQTYRALIIYDTAAKTFIALAINQHVSVEAVARKLLSLVRL